MTTEYRRRLYGGYVSAHLGREDLEERLRVRRPFMESLVKAHFPPEKDAKIVEFGCGTGALLFYARKVGYTNMNGMDVSAEQVAAAGQLGISGGEQGDACGAIKAMGDGSVDAVVTIDLIEHLTRNEVIDFVDDICRVLRPGGRWITHQPNAASPFFGSIRYGDLTHETAYTGETIRQLALTCGFSSVTCYEDVPVAHGIKSRSRRVAWRGVAALLRAVCVVETGAADTIFSRNFLAVVKR